MSFKADTSGLRNLEYRLNKAGLKVMPTVVATVSKSSLDIKNSWRDNAKESSGKHASQYPFTVIYEMNQTPTFVESIISPVGGKGTQAPLKAVLEHGSANNPGHLDGKRALEEHREAIEIFMQAAVIGALASEL